MKKIIANLFSCIMLFAITVSLSAPIISASANEYEIHPFFCCAPENEC